MPDISIIARPMTLDDLGAVSQLGIASKRSWGYDTNQMRVFADELTFSPDAFRGLLAAEVACLGGEIVGYFTIRQHADGGTELEHLFVAPERFHQGIGRMLFRSADQSGIFARNCKTYDYCRSKLGRLLRETWS